jgi:PAS domain S-box-containing protein
VFLVIALVAVIGGRAFYLEQERYYRDEYFEKLALIGQLKTDELVTWRDDLVSDGELFRRNPEFVRSFRAALGDSGDSAARQELAWWLEGLRSMSAYDSAFLIDANGDSVAASSLLRSVDGEHVKQLSESFLGSGSIGFVDPHRDDDGIMRMAMVAPLVDTSRPNETLGALVLTVNPHRSLFPHLLKWPYPSNTAETALVRRDGTDVLFLNNTRLHPDAALSRRVPMTAMNLPEVQAVRGTHGIVEAQDEQGHSVVAYLQKVPNTEWYLVSQEAEAEAFARLNGRLTLIVVVIALLVGSVAIAAVLVWRDERLRHYRSEFRFHKERTWLRDIIEHSLNEVYVFERDSLRFRFVNVGAAQNLGFGQDELAGTPIDDVLDEKSREALHRRLELLTAGSEESVCFDAFHRRKDGTLYPVEIHLQPADSDRGPVFLGVAIDITERRIADKELLRYQTHLKELVAERTRQLTVTNEELDTANEELQTLNEELENTNEELFTSNTTLLETVRHLDQVNIDLEEATAAKSSFLACMSHELRTPLNSIIGFSGVLKQGLAGELNEEQLAQIEMINRSGNHLLALINDVLDLSRVESGRVELEFECFVCDDVLRQVVDAMRPVADEKNLTLTIECSDSTRIYSDRAKVSQILFNLLGNAIKFTEVGDVTARFATTADGTVRFSIEDTGIGIPPEDIGRVFELFTQLQSPSSGKAKGTGLGLALSQQYATMLGGTITVDSTHTVGSTFTLTLPSAEDNCSGA